MDLENQMMGSIVGAAVGDALGMPTEYISPKELNELYKGKVTKFENPSSHHPCAHLHAGQYTDDTQQIILLAQSLIEKETLDIFDLAKKLGEWAYKCTTIPGYNRFAGGTSISAGLDLYHGNNPLKTGKMRATCGSAMRVAPLGLFYFDNLPNLKEAAVLSSRLTHVHPAAIDSAVFISHLIAYLARNEPLEKSVYNAQQTLTSDLSKNISFVTENFNLPPNNVAKIIGASESCYETIPMAIHCFLHTPRDFEATVVNAANLVPGDTDSIACIAGALSGAYNGLDSIPDKFKEQLEDFTYLKELGKKMLRV